MKKSIDSGASWIELTSGGNRSWVNATISGDGNTILGAVIYGYLYISRDGGITWTTTTSTGTHQWETVASTPDGNKLAAGALTSDYVYTRNMLPSWVYQLNLGISYTPSTPAHWTGADPTTVYEALNRIAAALTTLGQSP